MSGIKEMYRRHRALQFVTKIIGIFAWLAIYIWLSSKADWPDGYGFQCHGRGCLFQDLGHSPALLKHGGLVPDLTFIWLWAPALIYAAYILWAMLRPRPDNLESTSYISDPE
jgi:hypothetical protein